MPPKVAGLSIVVLAYNAEATLPQLVGQLAERQRFIEHMKQRGILSVFHYLPLHLSEMGRKYGGRPGDCTVTEDISDRLVRLPLYNSLSESEQAYVIEAILSFDAF